MQNKGFLLYLSLVVFMVLVTAVSCFAASVPRMSSDELNSRLSEEGLVVLDARAPYHWGSSDIKILGAERVEPGAVSAWSGNYSKEQTLVLYCA